MKLSFLAAAITLSVVVTGCVAIADNESEIDTVAANTELAVRICGSAMNVAEVTLEGYRCKDALK